jgi:hypothetical protein
MATTRVAVAPMKAAQIPKPGADFQIVDREIPQPGPGPVRGGRKGKSPPLQKPQAWATGRVRQSVARRIYALLGFI